MMGAQDRTGSGSSWTRLDHQGSQMNKCWMSQYMSSFSDVKRRRIIRRDIKAVPTVTLSLSLVFMWAGGVDMRYG